MKRSVGVAVVFAVLVLPCLADGRADMAWMRRQDPSPEAAERGGALGVHRDSVSRRRGLGPLLAVTSADDAVERALVPPRLLSMADDDLCPALDAPNGPTVTVSTEAALRHRAHDAAPGTTILVADGVYDLQDAVHVVNDGITIRGASGNRDDVVLDGGGMLTWSNTHVISIEADDVTVADLTIRNGDEHGVSVQGSDRPLLYNLHIVDAGYQLVKVNPVGDGSEDGVLACSRLAYTTTSPEDYTNGISAHDAHRWTVRDNAWYRIRTPGNEPVPTILFWSGSSDTIVERNLLVDCYQGISFGNASHGGGDHTGGIVRNNVIYASRPHDVVVEMVHATGWLVAHNTALLLNPDGVTWGMEARFSDTKGTFAYNLTNMAIWPDRDGAGATATGNVTAAQPDWFVNAASGDLHLSASATAAVDQAESLPQVTDDFDGDTRPTGSAPDVGADERSVPTFAHTVFLPLVLRNYAPSPPTPPPSGDLIQPSDLLYRGAFAYPAGDEWAYSGHALAYYPHGDPTGPADGHPGSLYAAGHAHHDLVGEISIPAPVNASGFDDLPRAPVLQPLADITGGWSDNCAYAEGCIYREVDGLDYLPNVDKIVWNLRDWYNTAGHDQDSLGWSDLDMTGAQGVWHIGERPSEDDLFHNAKTCDYLFRAPPGFADRYLGGKWLIAGNHREAGALGGSQGPTLYALAPWDDGNPPTSGQSLDALALLHYPEVYDCVWEGEGDINEHPEPGICHVPNYRAADRWGGGVWVEADSGRGILIFGRKGLGDNCYDTGEACGGDPCSIYRGYHAYPYEPQILFYDPGELGEVVAGRIEAWDVLPYTTYSPTERVIGGECALLGAAAYDQERGLIYVVEPDAGPWGETVVHVWQVD